MKKAIIAGASGLIGNLLCKILLEDNNFSEVTVLLRKPLNYNHPKLKQVIIDYEQISQSSDYINGDVFYSCLGTTKSKTPDLQEYTKIEYDYCLAFADICVEKSIQQFHFISALGANSKSTIFYNKIKGKTEEALIDKGLISLHLYRPSLLTGNRKEFRLGERIAILLMKIINPLLFGPLKKYQSISAKEVARAMKNQTLKELTGIYLYTSDKIKQLA